MVLSAAEALPAALSASWRVWKGHGAPAAPQVLRLMICHPMRPPRQ